MCCINSPDLKKRQQGFSPIAQNKYKRSLKSFITLKATQAGSTRPPPTNRAQDAALATTQSCAGFSASPAAAESQPRVSLVSSVNILDLFQHELNTNPVIQLGQLLPPGQALKRDVCTCFRLHVAGRSRGIQEGIFPLCTPDFFLCLKHKWH